MAFGKRSVFFALVAVFVATLTGVSFYSGAKRASQYEFIVASKIDLTEEINVSGKVKAGKSLDLAFQRGGIVDRIPVKVGDRVSAGQELGALRFDQLAATLKHARAGVLFSEAQVKHAEAVFDSEESKLRELKKGTRSEEVKIAETKSASAKNALADGEKTLTETQSKASVDLENLHDDVPDLLAEAFQKSNDAISQQVDEFFQKNNFFTYDLTFLVNDSAIESDLRLGYGPALEHVQRVRELRDELSDSPSAIERALSEAQDHLLDIRTFLNRLSDGLDKAGALSIATINTYKTQTNTGITNVNASLAALNNQSQLIAAQKSVNRSAISAAEAKVNDARNAVTLADDELKLKKAGFTKEAIQAQDARVDQARATIASQKAQLKQAQATVEQTQAQIAEAILRSPFNAVVTRIGVDVGESVAPNSPVIFLNSSGDLSIEAFVPEVDIASLTLGDRARLTFDAFAPDLFFEASVTAIDPAETIREGVTTYKVTVVLTAPDQRILPGMTADIDIEADRRDSVIAIPQRAVVTRDGKKMVRVLAARGEVIEVPVTTGLRGSDGNVEIIEGISEGDRVIIFEHAKNSAH